MATQVEMVGAQAAQNPANPLGGVLAGVQTGADWALQNAKIQNQKQELDAQIQKTSVEALKNRMEMGKHIHERMMKIATLPNGPSKDAQIQDLDNDTQQLGLGLSDTARAIMKDKNYSQSLPQILEMMDSSDPNEQARALLALPYILSDNKAVMEWVQNKNNELGKFKRTAMIATSNLASRTAEQDLRKQINENTLSSEEKRNEARIAGENQRQQEDLKFKREELRAKLAADKGKNVKDLTSELGKDAQKAFGEYKDVLAAIKNLETTASRDGGVWDAFILGPLDTLRSGKVSALREADMKSLGAPNGAFDRVDQLVANVQNGAKIGPAAKAQIRQLTQELKKGYMSSYMDMLSPTVSRVSAVDGMRPAEVFTDDQLRILGAAGIFKNAKSVVGEARKKALQEKSSAPAPSDSAPAAGKAVTLTPDKLSVVRKLLFTGTPYETIKQRIGGELNPNQKKLLGIQ